MNIFNNIKSFFQEKRRYWYIIISLITILLVLNDSLLSIVVDEWVCTLISVILILFATIYMKFIYDFIKSEHISNVKLEKEMLLNQFDMLNKEMNILNQKNIELEHKLASNILESVDKHVDNIIIKSIDLIESSKQEIGSRLNSIESDLNIRLDKDVDMAKEHLEGLVQNEIQTIDKMYREILNIINDITINQRENNTSVLDKLKLQKDIFNKQIENQDVIIKESANSIEIKIQDMYTKYELYTKQISENVVELLSNGIKNITADITNNKEVSRVIHKENMDFLMQMEESMKEKIQKVTICGYEVEKHILSALESASDEMIKTEKERRHIIFSESNKLRDEVRVANKNQIQVLDEYKEYVSNTKEELQKEIEATREIYNNVSDKIYNEVISVEQNTIDKIDKIINSINMNSEASMLEARLNSNNVGQAIKQLEDRLDYTIDLNDAMKSELQNDIICVQDKLSANMDTHILSVINKFDDINRYNIEKTEEFSNRSYELQNVLTDLFMKISDSTSKNTNKLYLNHENILSQISKLDKDIETIVKTLDSQIIELNSINKITNDTQKAHIIQSKDFKNMLSISSESINSSKVELITKIDDLKSQLTSLNGLSDVVKNIALSITNKEENNKKALKVESVVSKDIKQGDRVEEIKDKDSDVIIRNHYKNDKLKLSEMITGKNKTYDMEYDNDGKILKTHNYGSKGEVTTKLEFYKNGQVKKRTENINKNGKKQVVISKFDEQGKKLK